MQEDERPVLKVEVDAAFERLHQGGKDAHLPLCALMERDIASLRKENAKCEALLAQVRKQFPSRTQLAKLWFTNRVMDLIDVWARIWWSHKNSAQKPNALQDFTASRDNLVGANAEGIHPRNDSAPQSHTTAKSRHTIAFIDAQNLYKGLTRELGWKSLNLESFRTFLRLVHGTTREIVFIGQKDGYEDIHEQYKALGYELKYKKTHRNKAGEVKANVDSDLIVFASREYTKGRLGRAVIVANDRDYVPLAEWLEEEKVLCAVIVSSKAHIARDCWAPFDRCIQELSPFRSYLEAKQKGAVRTDSLPKRN